MKELWRKIKGSELYQVSNMGNVRVNAPSSTGEFMDVPKYYHTQGYANVLIGIDEKPKRVCIHRLVADAFLRNPENKPHVCHRNGVRNDNRSVNLKWSTPGENTAHYLRLSRRKVGRKTKLTVETASLIYALHLVWAKKSFLARLFNVSYSTVTNICMGRSWHKRIMAYSMKYKKYRPIRKIVNPIDQSLFTHKIDLAC